MKTVDQLIGDIHSDNVAEREWAQKFWRLCSQVFGDPAGQELLRMICRITDPLGSPLRGSAEETHVAIGRMEWIAALWRRSQPSIQPSDASALYDHASESPTNTDSDSANRYQRRGGQCAIDTESEIIRVSKSCPGCELCAASPAD